MKHLTLAAVLAFCVGCEPSAPPPAPSPSATAASSGEPDHITVQHILISFTGCQTKATRSQAEAKELAENVFQWAKGGESFLELVKKYTDDSPPGIYKMSNKGVKDGPGERNRTRMVGAFGNVGFKLKVGEIGMSTYDSKESPYGWHIIKRLD